MSSIHSSEAMASGSDRLDLRTAETIGEGTRLGSAAHHLTSFDSSDQIEFDKSRHELAILLALAIGLVCLIFVLLVLVLYP